MPRLSSRAPLRRILFSKKEIRLRKVTYDYLACGHKVRRGAGAAKKPGQMRCCQKCWTKQC